VDARVDEIAPLVAAQLRSLEVVDEGARKVVKRAIDADALEEEIQLAARGARVVVRDVRLHFIAERVGVHLHAQQPAVSGGSLRSASTARSRAQWRRARRCSVQVSARGAGTLSRRPLAAVFSGRSVQHSVPACTTARSPREDMLCLHPRAAARRACARALRTDGFAADGIALRSS
jgi:hypothetical protein